MIPVYEQKCQSKSWKYYLKKAISDPRQLLSQLNLSSQQLNFNIDPDNSFAMRVPQPYIDKIVPGDSVDPLLLQVLPHKRENTLTTGFCTNPLQENDSHANGLLHKYHGRALLIVAATCAINCRYCFRRHFPYQQNQAAGEQLDASLEAITADSSIHEVILSGGEPLLLGDSALAKLVSMLDEIPHLRRLRIHSRMPVAIPQRITEQLARTLAQSRLKTSIVLHINHPNEIDDLMANYLQKLVTTGVQLLNQSVLLKNVNDDAEILTHLSEKLFETGILPYYLHQLDRVAGAAHFEVSDKRAITIIQQLRASLPGYLIPRLAREKAGAESKTILA